MRVPPQDQEAEKALLAAIMLKPSVMYDVVDIIFPDVFYSKKHQIIFDAMYSLFQKSEPIDFITLTNKLKEKDQLKNIGGKAYISELTSLSPSLSNAIEYAKIIKGKYILRQLIEAGDKIEELGYNEQDDIESVLDNAQSIIYKIANTGSLENFKFMKEELKEAWQRLETLQESSESLRGIPTGFSKIDNLLAGFQKSDLIILAARPSMGKTAFSLDIARHVAVKEKIPVGIFSLEMSSQQLVDRMLAAEAQVDAWRLRTGRLKDDDEYQRLSDAMAKLSEAPIYIDDKVDRTVLQMRAIARRLKAEKGLGLIIIDYLQLITPSQGQQNDSMVQRITEISRSLKAMARELDVPVIALSQLSRAVEQRRDKPRLSDLRDSGSIEQDADVVMFIHREDKLNPNTEKKNIAEILIEKHRNGPIGKVELYFDAEKARFVQLENQDFSDYEPDLIQQEHGNI